MQKFPSFPFYLERFLKVTFLLFVGVYSWTPYFLLVNGLAFDLLLPFEVGFFIVLSFVSFGWVVKLVVEMLRK